MKKRITAVLLSFMLLLGAYPAYAAGIQDTIQSVKDANPVSSVTVSFQPNGGSGSMNNLTITNTTSGKLTSNTFTRKNFTFIGWNTQADGSGTNYPDQAPLASLTANATQGQAITLYAQWKINAPKIIRSTNTPNTTPLTLPVPPTKDTPPITQAAIASHS